MQAVLDAIAEPRRRQILELVREQELPAGEIALNFPDVSRPAVSQHLGVLRSAGLVNERRQGTSRLYSARPEGLADVREFLELFWEDRLETLKALVEKETAERNPDATDRAGR